MNHWETHLYTYAVALTQGAKIKPENLLGVRNKALRKGHTEDECEFVESKIKLFISTGKLGGKIAEQTRCHLICSICGSTDVRADAFAQWDADSRKWELAATFDEKHCENCETSTSLLEVDEASQLEIQAFGMVNVEEGSRLAEGDETPDFFDVNVSASSLEGGLILSLEEHDDMTAEEAAKTLSAMIKAYPLAGS